MALPILNETPKYTMKVPSTGKNIKYRPYLVKEEKILLLANESKDPEQIMGAIGDTIEACCDNKLKAKDLTTFDLEYIFIKIRSKSVGEQVTLNLPCEGCGERVEASINLDEVVCPVTKTKNVIEIDDNVAVELKWPSYSEIETDDDAGNTAINLLISCISAVISNDERIDIQDESKENVVAFLESMTSSQFQLLSEFITNIPAVKHDLDYSCDKCGHDNSIEIKGMQSFF